jgi:hypothetical protein
MKKKFTFGYAFMLAVKKYGSELGMFSRLVSKNGNVIRGKYISHSLNKIITKDELLKFEANTL